MNHYVQKLGRTILNSAIKRPQVYILHIPSDVKHKLITGAQNKTSTERNETDPTQETQTHQFLDL